MENDKLQKELFEFEAPKKVRRPRLGQFLQRSDFAFTLTAEKLVFLTIGITMLVVVFFALGVEKGKSLAVKNAIPQVSTQMPVVQAKAQSGLAQVPKVAAVNTNITPKEKNTVPVAGDSQAKPDDKPYTIVAAAFLRQDFASKEAGTLKGSGLDAFVIKGDQYYLACVGSFANKDSAQKILSKVRQVHRDAYIKLK